jgi:hypothetical protein
MAWTKVSEPSSSWTAEQGAPRVFSPNVFSHAFLNGKRVFSMGSPAGIWDADRAPTSTWTLDAS